MGAGNYQHQRRRNVYNQQQGFQVLQRPQSQYMPYPQQMTIQKQHSQPLMRQLPQQQSQPLVILNELCISEAKLVDNRLVLVINTLTPAQVQFHVRCIESVNPATLVSIGIHSSVQTQTLELPQAVQKYQFTSDKSMDQSIYINEHSNYQMTWPLLVKMMNPQMQMFYYYEIEHGDLKLKHQKYQSAQGAFEVNEIYGINDSGLIEGGTNKVPMREDLKENCTICVSEIVNTIIMPCRHMCVCTDCAQLIQEKKVIYDQQRQLPQQQRSNLANPNTCPICRKEIESFIRLKKIN